MGLKMPRTKVEIDVSRLDTQRRKDKAILCAKEIETVINSELFKNNFLELLRTRKFSAKNAETSKFRYFAPSRVLKHFLEGSETLSPGIDYTFNIVMDDYYTIKRVIGMTYGNKPAIYVNTKYYDSPDTKGSGSNIVHEHGHKLGFRHIFRSKPSRNDSICYILNAAYEMTWEVLFGNPHKPKRKYCYRPWKYLKLKKVCYWK